jgi:hypothetical protein
MVGLATSQGTAAERAKETLSSAGLFAFGNITGGFKEGYDAAKFDNDVKAYVGKESSLGKMDDDGLLAVYTGIKKSAAYRIKAGLQSDPTLNAIGEHVGSMLKEHGVELPETIAPEMDVAETEPGAQAGAEAGARQLPQSTMMDWMGMPPEEQERLGQNAQTPTDPTAGAPEDLAQAGMGETSGEVTPPVGRELAETPPTGADIAQPGAKLELTNKRSVDELASRYPEESGDREAQFLDEFKKKAFHDDGETQDDFWDYLLCSGLKGK